MAELLKAMVLDLDGVLTDGTFAVTTSGEQIKRFHFRDVMGISLARKRGLQFAIITGEQVPQSRFFAEKVGITDLFENCKDKVSALNEFIAKNNLSLREVCFMGDDINDIEAMKLVGYSACPRDAHFKVCEIASLISDFNGGSGAVRDVLDKLFLNKV